MVVNGTAFKKKTHLFIGFIVSVTYMQKFNYSFQHLNENICEGMKDLQMDIIDR